MYIVRSLDGAYSAHSVKGVPDFGVRGPQYSAGTSNTRLFPSLIDYGQWLHQYSGWTRCTMCYTQKYNSRFAQVHIHHATSHHMWAHGLEYVIYKMPQCHNRCRCVCTSVWTLWLRLWPRFVDRQVERSAPNKCPFILRNFSFQSATISLK